MLAWVKKFKKHAPSARIWGLHNYKDANDATGTTRTLLRPSGPGLAHRDRRHPAPEAGRRQPRRPQAHQGRAGQGRQARLQDRQVQPPHHARLLLRVGEEEGQPLGLGLRRAQRHAAPLVPRAQARPARRAAAPLRLAAARTRERDAARQQQRAREREQAGVGAGARQLLPAARRLSASRRAAPAPRQPARARSGPASLRLRRRPPPAPRRTDRCTARRRRPEPRPTRARRARRRPARRRTTVVRVSSAGTIASALAVRSRACDARRPSTPRPQRRPASQAPSSPPTASR